MLELKIWEDSRSVGLYFKKMNKDTIKGIRNAFLYIGAKLRYDIGRNILKGGRQGNKYKYRIGTVQRTSVSKRQIRRAPKGTQYYIHTASIVGETAANITGAYRKSIQYKMTGKNRLTIGSVSDMDTSKKIFYGKYLELGQGVGPRPGLAIGIQQNNKNMQDRLTKEIQKQVSLSTSKMPRRPR